MVATRKIVDSEYGGDSSDFDDSRSFRSVIRMRNNQEFDDDEIERVSGEDNQDQEDEE